MSAGNLQTAHGICPEHGPTKVERNAMVWGLGDVVMVLFTCGLWLAARAACAPAWKCSTCGRKARRV